MNNIYINLPLKNVYFGNKIPGIGPGSLVLLLMERPREYRTSFHSFLLVQKAHVTMEGGRLVTIKLLTFMVEWQVR